MNNKFKVLRLNDFGFIENNLNDFDLGNILDVSVSMPDYRVIVLVIRYEPKDDKPAK
jgi:hypothetical protein